MTISHLIRMMLVFAVVFVACAGQDQPSSPGSTSTAPTDDVEDGEMTPVTLILDFVPGGIHAGLYSAVAEGYFEDANLDVALEPPASAADTLRLVIAGRATIGIAPLADVASLRSQGEDVRVFMALEQVPLGGLLSTEAIGVTDPGQLGGATIGVTGVPSDVAIAEVILDSAGVDPSTVDFITIGFDAVGNLIGRTVDAAFGFWSAEAVALDLAGEVPVVFRPDEHGAPLYPELVFFSTGDRFVDEPLTMQAFMDAVTRGYEFALANPDDAIAHLDEGADGIDEVFATAEFAGLAPYFLDAYGRFGTIDPDALGTYLDWAADVGIIESVPPDLLVTEFTP